MLQKQWVQQLLHHGYWTSSSWLEASDKETQVNRSTTGENYSSFLFHCFRWPPIEDHLSILNSLPDGRDRKRKEERKGGCVQECTS